MTSSDQISSIRAHLWPAMSASAFVHLWHLGENEAWVSRTLTPQIVQDPHTPRIGRGALRRRKYPGTEQRGPRGGGATGRDTCLTESVQGLHDAVVEAVRVQPPLGVVLQQQCLCARGVRPTPLLADPQGVSLSTFETPGCHLFKPSQPPNTSGHFIRCSRHA